MILPWSQSLLLFDWAGQTADVYCGIFVNLLEMAASLLPMIYKEYVGLFDTDFVRDSISLRRFINHFLRSGSVLLSPLNSPQTRGGAHVWKDRWAHSSQPPWSQSLGGFSVLPTCIQISPMKVIYMHLALSLMRFSLFGKRTNTALQMQWESGGFQMAAERLWVKCMHKGTHCLLISDAETQSLYNHYCLTEEQWHASLLAVKVLFALKYILQVGYEETINSHFHLGCTFFE